MGHGTSSGRTPAENPMGYSQRDIEAARDQLRQNAEAERQAIARSTYGVTPETIAEAFASLGRTRAGFLGDTEIGRVADVIDQVRPGVRLEVRNERRQSDDSVYYERNASGDWYRSVVTRGRLSDRRPMSNSRQVVADILTGGVIAHPNRLRVINAR